jgi:glycosyltransferase involved in cell wall biosynthesis
MMKKPALSVPIVGTVHDFNWKYFFGQQIFPLPYVREMDVYIQDWLNNVNTVSSSHDVITELKKLYPATRKQPVVIPIAPVVFSHNVSSSESKEILSELGLDYPYIIFPGNFFPHKNHLNLFAAFSLLKKRKGFDMYKLVLTGVNSDQIPYAIAGRTGIQMVTENSPNREYDIRGLGYQSNKAIEVLIKNARLLISPSIYEAICTPAMDAWFLGTPTAISDIPPFREHEQVWGVKSAFFDPMNIENIADTLEAYLNDPERARADAEISRQAIAKYTWPMVAQKYLEVFHNSINEYA